MIYVDSREDRSIFLRLKKLTDEVELRTLDSGDYILTHNDTIVGIERKTADDFINSIVDGRLNNELYRLSADYPISYLLVQGSVTEAMLYREDFSRRAYISALVNASIKRADTGYGSIPQVIVLEYLTDIVYFIYFLHERVKRGDFLRYPVPQKINNSQVGLLAGMLTVIPGIGEDKAKKIAIKYKTLKRFVNEVSFEDLRAIPGIGDTLAKRIVEVVIGV